MNQISVRAVTKKGELLLEHVIPADQAVVLGRGSSANLQLANSMVSSKHVEISSDGVTLKVRDLKSQNGTFHGDQRIAESELPMPCALDLGGTVIVSFALLDEATDTQHNTQLNYVLEKAATASPPAGQAPLYAQVWTLIKAYPGQKIVLNVGIAGLIYAFLKIVLAHAAIGYTLSIMVAFDIGIPLASLMLASLLALPGWLIRGSYDVKPLFTALALSSFCTSIANDVLLPVSFSASFGLIGKLFYFPLCFVGLISALYLFMLTTLPHKWAKTWLVMSGIIATMALMGSYSEDIRAGRRAFMAKVFESSEATLVPMLEKKIVTPATVRADLTELEHELSQSSEGR